ncbi:unnamed protein product [Brugia pahangi]|uniref:Transmembrane protein n=1 Tax=Brugia pahangi TaxID=6280 RepID=A0A0N4TZT7_BRUPA|nr:unnamed protein product [Brugia pahangi]
MERLATLELKLQPNIVWGDSEMYFQVEKLLIPVTLNIMLTLIVWIGIYYTKKDSNSVFYYKLDPVHNHTTENEIVDGMGRALEACK